MAAGVGIAATAALAAALGFGIGGHTVTLYVDDIATAAAALVACACCVVAARARQGAERRVWTLLACATGLWTLAEVVWGIYELALNREVPVPSWADVGYLGAIPFAAAGLASHPATARNVTRTARYVFDSLLIACALLYLSWSLVLRPLGQLAGAGTAERVVTFAYPFGDVVLLFFVVLAIRGMRRGNRLSMWCLLGGLIAMVLADSVYASVSANGYETGDLMDVGWIVAYIGIALAAVAARSSAPLAELPESRSPTLAVLAAPFVLVLGALTVAAAQMQAGSRPDRLGLVTVGALIALVLGRQALLLREYVGLAGTRALNASERLVRAAAGGPQGRSI